jgi:hypothetical protein
MKRETQLKQPTGGVSAAVPGYAARATMPPCNGNPGAERLAGGSAEHSGALRPFQHVGLDQYLIGACAEKREALTAQSNQAHGDNSITCGCGWVRWIGFAYRCLYCGEWFCGPCAETHFGKTIEDWTIEKRIAKRLEIQARINSRSDGAEPVGSQASDDISASPHNA